MSIKRDSSLRIMMIVHRLQSGGAERQLIYLSRGLAELGNDVVVVTLGEKGNEPIGWSTAIPLFRLKSLNNYDPSLVVQLCLLIRRIRPDIIQTWNPQTDIMGGIATILNGGRWIIREPNAVDSYQYGWKGKLRALIARKADLIVSNSSGGDDYWHSIYPKKLRHIIRNGLPLNEIDKTRPIDRQELGLEKDQNFVLYAGRLTRQKRVEHIINAFADLPPDSKTVAFICGEGEELNMLRDLARYRGVEDRINFTGFLKIDTIWGMMKSADLFINLSYYEGMPNTVMEAMACGCPLLVSDIPAHREILDEHTACLVSTRKTADVTKELTSLLSPQAAKSKQARALAAERKARSWSIEAMAKQYEGIYNSILSRPEDDLER